MKALTKEGQQYVDDIAAKYNLKTETVETLLRAIINGNGKMAQFNLSELGGSGQWMRGGLTQVGDMFNVPLRVTVDKICNELSDLASTKVLYEEGEAHATERSVQTNYSTSAASSSWPSVFGSPTSSGSQNNFKYAYFAPVRRLIIDDHGKRTIYDTRHHQITGISQQQSSGSSYQFTSQDGPVDLNSLSVISEPASQAQPTPEIAYDVTSTADLRSTPGSQSTEDSVFATIEKLNALYERGQITEEEFKSKKQELLSRL